MDHDRLVDTAQAMVASGRGILAADESNNTANKRLESVGIETSEENRRQYRQVLITTPNLEESISGIILYDETYWQNTDDQQPFRTYLSERGIMPGIKVDAGLVEVPGFDGATATAGLDGLPERMEKYASYGARFAKWRAAMQITDHEPLDEIIGANAYSLARYARICQEYNIVPMLEPEVLFDGNHSIERCEEVTRNVYRILFDTMRAYRVDLAGAILKTGMVLPGKESEHVDADQVAERTSTVLLDCVPQELGGVVFLSGGQPPNMAMIHLDKIKEKGPYPWGVTFSYSRALQDPVLRFWAENQHDVSGAQEVFKRQLHYATTASTGELDEKSLESNEFVTEGQD